MGDSIMNFEEMSKTDVTSHITKKGQFNYLSWPYAVAEFRKACPNGRWKIKAFGETEQPYCQTDSGCFVMVSVCPDIGAPSIVFTQVHPVLDNRNKTIKEPNAFQINTSIQRCLVKAIALATGIGLFIYAGEDLPPGDKNPEDDKKFEDDGEQLSKYTNHIDKLGSSAEIEKYTNSVYKQAKKELSEQDYEKFISYSKQAVQAWGAGKKDVVTHIAAEDDILL
jgi:hypothetical protein